MLILSDYKMSIKLRKNYRISAEINIGKINLNQSDKKVKTLFIRLNFLLFIKKINLMIINQK